MPTLDVPTRMVVERNGHESATFALSLIEAGLLEDGDQTGDSNALICGVLGTLLPDLDELSVDYNIGVINDETMLWLEVAGVSLLPITAFAARCDAVHEALGPSILSCLYRASLNPPFTPELAHETVDMHYWMGEGDDGALLDDAAYTLARARNVERSALSDGEISAYADSHCYTQNTLNDLLEPRYQMSGSLSIDDCIALCEPRCSDLTSICRLIKKVDELTDRVTHYRNAWDVFDEAAQIYPFILSLPRGNFDVVYEMACEREQYAMEVGQVLPIYATPLGDGVLSVKRMAESLRLFKEILELENALYQIFRSIG